MLYYGIFSIGLALADNGKIHVGLALWLPNIVASIIACVLVWKIVSEKWVSVSDGVFAALARFTTSVSRRLRFNA
jgi:hypothetical protein